MRMELRKQQMLPEGFVAAMTVTPSLNSDSNCTEQNPNHSSPFGAFFDQFCYKPVRQDRNPLLPRTPDGQASLPPQGYPSFKSSQLTTNQTSKASKANTSVVSKTKQQEEADAPKSYSMMKSNGKKPRVLSKHELIKMRMELRKQQMLPEGFVAAMTVAPSLNSDSNCTEQNPNHSSPFGAFFDQFCYKPVRQDRNPLLPRTPDRLSRLPARGYPSFELSQLTTNETSKASMANTSAASKTKQQDSGSGSQEKINVKEKENPEKKTRTKKQRKPSGQSPLPFDPCQTHCVQLQPSKAPPEQEKVADGPKGNNIKTSNGKKPHVRVLSNGELMKLRKQQTLPEGFVAAMTLAPSPNSESNCTEQNPNHSSPFGAFFDQFCYKPVRQDRNLPLPRTPDRLSRLPPRGYPSFESSQLTANGTSKASKGNNSVASNTKQKVSGSGPASGSQVKVNVEKNPEKTTRAKKQRKPPPALTYAEKRSDKYRRLPLDELVPPPRSPHNLLQEEYASDPWKVIVICMLLNLTQGKQVRKKVEGFFKRYPDAQSAFNADPEKMAGYLAPLGLQHVKTNRIQKFSMEYVEKEWTYVTELCGVGKATDVVPEDHKLVDYWKYVCFELPMIQRLQNVQEAGVTELNSVSPRVRELVVCC